jgi:hypothetical protein
MNPKDVYCMASASIHELEHSLRFSHHKRFQLRITTMISIELLARRHPRISRLGLWAVLVLAALPLLAASALSRRKLSVICRW